MCLRVYAVTRRNKLLSGTLSLLIAAQLCFGIYFTVMYSMAPCELLNRSFICVWSHRLLVQPLPEIDLNVYKVCLPPKLWPGELTFAGISVTFCTLSPSDF